MTSPASALQIPPFGTLGTGSASPDIDTTRDDMINVFLQQTQDLTANTSYYTGQSRPEAIGIAVPPEMRKLLGQVGYPRLYIDAVSDRLSVEGFTIGDTAEGGSDKSQKVADMLWDWWQANDLDTESILGHTESLVHGRSYITIAAPDPAVDLNVDPTVPIIRVESPATIWANVDPRTRQVTQAIRYVTGAPGSPKEGQKVAATVYLPLQTVAYIVDDTGQWQIIQQIPHNLGIVPVVPMFNKTLLSSIYGTSEITTELRTVTDAASRILMDMQGAAELMAIPQRILFGVKPEDIGVDPTTGQSQYDAYMARILAFADPEGKAFQFAAAELRNFGDALDQLDRKAAQITGLPPQYLATTSDNPPSAEAIRAAEARLVKNCEQKTKIFGGAWEQAMRVAYMVMNGGAQTLPPEFLRMESVWTDPATPTYAAKADAATKLYAGGLGVIPKERARIDMGYSVAERQEMTVWDEQENPMGLLGAVAGPQFAAQTPPSSDTGGGTTSAAKPTETIDQQPQT
jgi:Phage portal protein, SPP1 Gp6-like